MALYDQGKSILTALTLGDASTVVRGIKKGTVSVNPPDATAGHETVSVAVTVTGVAVGDLVLMFPPATLEDDLVPKMAIVSNTDEVTVYLYAPAAVDGAALTWTYLWFDLT